MHSRHGRRRSLRRSTKRRAGFVIRPFIDHKKAAEMMLLRERSAKSPRPAKPGDTNENEGLAALRCILHICSLLFQQPEAAGEIGSPAAFFMLSVSEVRSCIPSPHLIPFSACRRLLHPLAQERPLHETIADNSGIAAAAEGDHIVAKPSTRPLKGCLKRISPAKSPMSVLQK